MPRLIVTYIYKDAVRLFVVILCIRHTSKKTSQEKNEYKEDQKRKKEQESWRIKSEEKKGTDFTKSG